MKTNQGFIKPLIILIVVVLIIIASVFIFTKQSEGNIPTQTAATSTAFSFPVKGLYQFDEMVADNNGLQNVWSYKLNFYEDNGGLRAKLNVDGFQTKLDANVSAKVVDGHMEIVFDSYGADNMTSLYKNGDVLFILTPAEITEDPTDLGINWQKIQPNLESSKMRSVFTKVEESANIQNHTSMELVLPKDFLYPGLTWKEEKTKPHGIMFDDIDGPGRRWEATENSTDIFTNKNKGFSDYYDALLKKDGWTADEIVVNGKVFTAPRGEKGWTMGSWGYLKNEGGTLKMIVLSGDASYSKWNEKAGEASTPACPCEYSYTITIGQIPLKNFDWTTGSAR